jgi:hypothetical protein
VIDIRRQVSFTPPQQVEVKSEPIRDGSLPPRAPAQAAESAEYVRHFASNAAHSRLPGILSDAKWTVKWSAELPSEPLSLLRSGNSILCQWLGMWRLYDSSGKQVAEDYTGASPVAIDARAGMFQLITDNLSWEARRLDNGDLVFRNALPYNEDYAWPVMFRSGSRMLAFANIKPGFSHEAEEKGSSLIQLIELGSPLQTDPGKLVQNLTRFETLRIAVENSRAAAEKDTIVMAGPDVIASFGSDLSVQRIATGAFTPVQLSLDESGWIHLFVEEQGRKSLWILQPDLTRVTTWGAPQDFGDLLQPPILGYDRRVYLLTRGSLTAIDASAKLLWTRSVPGAAVAGGVTINGQVLVSASSELRAFRPDGESTALHRFDAAITTPATYTSHHEILVGSGHAIYCLAQA